MEKLLAGILSWVIGMPIYLPWLLARVGIYKRWYFAPFLPPFSWRGWIQLWPMSAMFVSIPFLSLFGLTGDDFTEVAGIIGIVGIIVAVYMVLWTPGWAKPTWQRRLEERFSYEQVSEFIRIWKKMPFHEWCNKIETEEGMLELADYALENHAGHVDDAVRLRGQQLDNARERRLKRKPEWLFQDSEDK